MHVVRGDVDGAGHVRDGPLPVLVDVDQHSRIDVAQAFRDLLTCKVFDHVAGPRLPHGRSRAARCPLPTAEVGIRWRALTAPETG